MTVWAWSVTQQGLKMPVFLDQVSIDNKKFPVLKIFLKDKKIISIPTQIGCPVKCSFCVSKDSKFERNLTTAELNTLAGKVDKSTLLSFTGEGEPLLNYENINQTIETLYGNVESFRICFSGLTTRRLYSISHKDNVRLQFSMHSPKNSIRRSLITHTRPLEEIKESILTYGRDFKEVAINYVLMNGINDSDSDLDALMNYIEHDWIIKLNPLLDESDTFRKSNRHSHFYNVLKNNGFKVFQYNKIGSTIKNDFYSYLTYNRNIG